MRDNEFKARLRSHSRNMKNSIVSPFDITQKIDEMEMSDMTKKTVSFNWLKNVAYSAAALAVAFVLTFNCIPSLAYAASDVPILGDIVRVVRLVDSRFRKRTMTQKLIYQKSKDY